MKLAAVDYETDPIENRPDYPPEPVGCAIFVEGERPEYLAWGHPSENNTTRAEARKRIRYVIRHYEIIAHSMAFDTDVGETRLGLPIVGLAKRYHDTEILAYLHDPREESLALKPLSEKYLGMPPDEQTRLRNWIVKNVPECAAKAKKNKGKPPKDWGRWIGRAPGRLVSPYAKGDVLRTMKLFKFYMPYIRDAGMIEAYERELALIPLKLKMERAGVMTDARRLKRDIPKFAKARDKIEHRIRRRLDITKTYEAKLPKGFFNLNSGQQVADALERANKVDPKGWIYTEPSDAYPEGQRSTSLENLKVVCPDKKLITDLGMRSVCSTYCDTFLGPWIETGARDGGRIHPTFNLIRTTDEHGGSGTKGTKTGRPSSSAPNFNNVPANAADSKNSVVLLALAAFLKREVSLLFLGLRDYIIPDPGCIFIDRDYNQQEMRVFAHYENGALMDAYRENPKLDVHDMVKEIVMKLFGFVLPRKAIKIIAFMVIYGAGLDKLAFELGVDREAADEMRGAYLAAIPGLPDLDDELKEMVRENVPLRTWGGRLYDCEERVYSRKLGRWLDFDYKMLNLLIQGSSADITKEAMLKVDASIAGDIRLQVYDELLANTTRSTYRRDMARMREAMESVENLDVLLPTTGAYSSASWGRMKDYREAA